MGIKISFTLANGSTAAAEGLVADMATPLSSKETGTYKDNFFRSRSLKLQNIPYKKYFSRIKFYVKKAVLLALSP